MRPLVKIIDQGKDPVGRRPYHGRTLDFESVRLGRGNNKDNRDGESDNDGNDGYDYEHEPFPFSSDMTIRFSAAIMRAWF
jgi:hypothetical protein